MKKEAQQIAIAEACGWVKTHSGAWSHHHVPMAMRTQNVWVSSDICSHLPDYLNDLNAMHEAEKALTQDQFFDYCKALGRVLDTHTEVHGTRTAWRIHATANTRAEAFLRTIGKWVES